MLGSCEMLQFYQVGNQPATAAFWRARNAANTANPDDFVRVSGDWFGGEYPSTPYESLDRGAWTRGLSKYNFDDLLSSSLNLASLNTIREVLNEKLDYFSATFD